MRIPTPRLRCTLLEHSIMSSASTPDPCFRRDAEPARGGEAAPARSGDAHLVSDRKTAPASNRIPDSTPAGKAGLPVRRSQVTRRDGGAFVASESAPAPLHFEPESEPIVEPVTETLYEDALVLDMEARVFGVSPQQHRTHPGESSATSYRTSNFAATAASHGLFESTAKRNIASDLHEADTA